MKLAYDPVRYSGGFSVVQHRGTFTEKGSSSVRFPSGTPACGSPHPAS